jgi:hypothetical protein
MPRSIVTLQTFAVLILSAGLAVIARADPTPERTWRSTAGTTISAVATRMAGSTVELKTDDGRALTLAIDKLVDEDRAYLIKHFGLEKEIPLPGEPRRSMAAAPTGLAHPLGEVIGPVDAGDGSHYFFYLPKSLRADRPAPLLLYTGAGGGSAKSVANHIAGAEINGWIVAASVESRNGPGFPDENHAHAKRSYEHLLANLPVDDKRVYFTGNSGGGAMAFYNAGKLKSAGAMPLIGYILGDGSLAGGHYFVINGTNDYNRYTSANASAKFGEDAIHRFHVGGHSGGPSWLLHEGMTWLNGRYLAGKESSLEDERLDYEASVIDWVRELRAAEPHRALYWCTFLRDQYGIAGHNASVVESLAQELESDPLNLKYVEGIAAIDEFSRKNFAPVGTSSQFGHSTPEIVREAGQLAAEYSGVPEIEVIARALGEPSVSQGGKKK